MTNARLEFDELCYRMAGFFPGWIYEEVVCNEREILRRWVGPGGLHIELAYKDEEAP